MPSAGRPPFNGGPPLTTFAPDPDGPDENYLVNRARQMVDDVERTLRNSETEPEDALAYLHSVKRWLLELLERERMVAPTVLPPGIGILYSLDEMLEAETDAEAVYVRLLERLEDLSKPLEKEVSFRRLFEGWGPSLE